MLNEHTHIGPSSGPVYIPLCDEPDCDNDAVTIEWFDLNGKPINPSPRCEEHRTIRYAS